MSLLRTIQVSTVSAVCSPAGNSSASMVAAAGLHSWVLAAYAHLVGLALTAASVPTVAVLAFPATMELPATRFLGLLISSAFVAMTTLASVATLHACPLNPTAPWRNVQEGLGIPTVTKCATPQPVTGMAVTVLCWLTTPGNSARSVSVGSSSTTASVMSSATVLSASMTTLTARPIIVTASETLPCILRWGGL